MSTDTEINYDESNDINEAFSRNIGILTPGEQLKLQRSKVIIAGLGGIGGQVAIQLARMGIGNFNLADFDKYEITNINRQSGATVQTLEREKCDVVAEQIASINPQANIRVFKQGFNLENGDEILQDMDIAVDAIDFYQIESHINFHRMARKHGLFVLMGSPVGFSGCLQVYDPSGMGFEEYCAISDDMPALEKQIRYASGVVPGLAHLDYYDVSSPDSGTDFMEKTGPSLASAVSLAASMVCTELVIILLDRRKPLVIPYSHQFDPFTFRYYKVNTEGGMKNYNPKPALNKIKNRTTLISQVLNVLYAKPQAEPAKVNDVDMFYRLEGDEGKPVLVFINPLGVDSTFWDFVVERLKSDYRILVYDHRGTGSSTSSKDTIYSTEILAKDLLDLLSLLNINQCSLVGLALGACVAQLAAVYKPEMVKKMVLISAYEKSDQIIKEVTQTWRQIAQDHGLEVLFDQCLEWLFPIDYIKGNKGEIDQLRLFMKLTQQDPEIFCQMSLAGVNHDSSETTRSIKQPTLIMHGIDDKLVDIKHAELLAEKMENARFMPLESATHFLIWNNSEDFSERLDQFMKSGQTV